MNALNGLFRYLTVEAEHEEEVPHFYRNVMKQIVPIKNGKPLAQRAAFIKPQLMLDDTDFHYLIFIQNDYIHRLLTHQAAFFKINRKPNVAINALTPGKGFRISEAANASIHELELMATKHHIQVIRKGVRAN